MADEKILIQIEVDNDKAVADINKQNAAIDKLQKENKELASQGKKNSKQYQQNAVEIQKLNSARKQNIKLISSEKGSLNELRANLARLTTQRNAINTSTQKGSQEFKRLNSEILKQNKAIKGAEQAGGDFRRNVGNYGDALTTVNPAVGSAVSGFKAMKTAALAFIATPIGAVIAAIGLAVGALTQYFRDNEEGQNRLTKITNSLSAVWGVFTDKISEFGSIVFDAIENPKKAFVDLGDAIVQNLINRWEGFVGLITSGGSIVVEGFKALAAKVKIALADVPIIGNAIDLDQAQKDYDEATANILANTKEFAKNVIVATTGIKDPLSAVNGLLDDYNKKQEAAAKLSSAQIELSRREKTSASELATLQVQIAELRLKAKKEDEFTDAQRIAFLKEAQKLTDEQFKKEEDLARLRFEAKVQENQLSNTSLEDSKAEDELKAQLILKEQARLNANRKLETELQTLKRQEKNEEIQEEQNAANQLQRIRDREFKDKEKKAKAEKKLRKDVSKASLSLASNVFKGVSQFLEQGSKEQKAFAIADATINTAKGVSNALAYGPPPLNFINAAAVGAAGAAQIASIVATTPGSGGGGATPVTAQGTAQQQTNTNAIDQQLAQQEALIQATNNIGMSVSVTEINDVQSNVAISEQTATI